MAQEKLRVVVIPVDGGPYEETLDAGPGWDAFDHVREMVGGDVEILSVDVPCEGVDLMVNDEGMFACPPNRAIYATRAMEEEGLPSQVDLSSPVRENEPYTVLHGNIVATGFDPTSGDTVSLSEEQVSETLRYFERVSPAGSGAYEEQLICSRALARVIDDLGLDAGDVFVAMPCEAGPVRDDAPTNDEER